MSFHTEKKLNECKINVESIKNNLMTFPNLMVAVGRQWNSYQVLFESFGGVFIFIISSFFNFLHTDMVIMMVQNENITSWGRTPKTPTKYVHLFHKPRET